MKLEPLYDNVVVKIEEVSSKQEINGLIIDTGVSAGQLKQDCGIVVSTGEGRLTANGEIVPLVVSKGNKVMFNKFAGTEIKTENETLLILKESDILAIIE